MVPYPLYPLPRVGEKKDLCGEGDKKKEGLAPFRVNSFRVNPS